MRNRGHWIAIMCAAALTLGYCSGPLGDWRMRRIKTAPAGAAGTSGTGWLGRPGATGIDVTAG
jgi:hypothetical protein